MDSRLTLANDRGTSKFPKRNVQPEARLRSDRRVQKKYSISDELKERAYRFALAVLELATLLPDTDEGRVIRRQLCKSGTSAGANLEEADGSLTLSDFVYKVDVAFKEGKETRYWLRVILARKLVPAGRVDPVLDECVQLIKILSTIICRCLRY